MRSLWAAKLQCMSNAEYSELPPVQWEVLLCSRQYV